MSLRIPLVAVGAALLVGVAFVFLLYRPLGEEQTTLAAETVALEVQQASVSAQIAELEQIRSDEPRTRELLSRLEELIPSEVAQPRTLEELQAVADTAGVSIRSVSFADPAPAVPAVPAPDGQQLGVITTTVVMEGGYFQAVDFLRRLELDGPRAVLTQSVAVAEGEQRFPSLSTTWTGQLFALIPADVVAGEEAPVPNPSAAPGATPSPSASAAAAVPSSPPTEAP